MANQKHIGIGYVGTTNHPRLMWKKAREKIREGRLRDALANGSPAVRFNAAVDLAQDLAKEPSRLNGGPAPFPSSILSNAGDRRVSSIAFDLDPAGTAQDRQWLEFGL